MSTPPDIKDWHECDQCEFQGPMTFVHQADEDYSDDSQPAVMLDVTCPSCGTQENILMTWEHYHEILIENQLLSDSRNRDH